MKKYILVLLTLSLCFSFNYANAQETKKKDIQKEVKIQVDKVNGVMVKTINIVVKEDGEEKVMTWKGSDEAQIPEEMKQYMEDVEVIIEETVEMEEDEKMEIEKEIIVEVDEEEKQIKIKVIENGKEKVMVWEGDDEKEMPAEMKEMMEDSEIIFIDKRGDKKMKKKKIKLKEERKEKVKIVIKGDDGKEKIMEWNGEGEMPGEMKKHLEESDIDIESYKTGQQKRVRIRKEMDGEHKTMKFESHDEIPREIREKLEKEGIKMDGENIFIMKGDAVKKIGDDNVIIIKKGGKGEKMEWHSDSDGPKVIHMDPDKMMGEKPRLGVMIENDIAGVKIQDVVSGSAAEKAGLLAGDIIYKVGKMNVGSTLQLTESLKSVASGSTAKIKILRSGQKMTIKAVL